MSMLEPVLWGPNAQIESAVSSSQSNLVTRVSVRSDFLSKL